MDKINMNKAIVIGVFLLMFILISGCNQLPQLPNIPGLNKQDDKPSVGRGVRLFFADDAPPKDRILVGENSAFLIRVGIENYGDEIDDAELKLYDNLPGTKMEDNPLEIGTIEAAFFRYSDDGDVITNIIPSRTFTETKRVSYTEEEIVSGTKLNVFAELFIPQYRANIATNLCLKRETDPDPTCSNKEVITQTQLRRQAQYMPVTVERIEKTATPLSENDYFINLKITFRNFGGGTIESVGGVKDETGRKLFQSIETPHVSLGGNNAECSPTPELIFDNDVAVLNCFISGITAKETFLIYPLTIGYEFGYKLRAKVGPVPLVKISDLGRSV